MPTFNERWLNVVRSCNLDLTKPINFVSTADITKYGGMETRKMVSIETEKKNPEIFRQHGVFATPVSIKMVAIVQGKGFETLKEFDSPPQVHKTDFSFPEYLRKWKSHSEAPFLTYAFNCGLVSKFTGRPALRSDFSGKARVYFKFRVDGHEPLNVEGAQIEVDSSFSDEERFYLCESKFEASPSFNIRQLYYPYRHFADKVKPKQVGNLFFSYESKAEEYHFWEYTFTDPDDYEKIDLIGSARYKVEFTKDPQPLKKYVVAPVQQEAIQANNVYFLMDVPFLVADGIDDTAKIAQHFGVDRRQGQYYGKGITTLGLVERRGNKFTLTNEGERYIGLPPDERTRFFISRLVENPPVSEALHRIIAGETLGLSELMQITQRNDPKISGATIKRRALCLRSYFKLIADVMGYLVVSKGAVSLHNPRETLNGYK